MTGVDGCFHLAAVASVELSNRDWLRTHRTNLTGAITVFDAAIAAGPVPVVYASSAAVYGNCPSLPLRECSEKQPLSAYGADKLGVRTTRLDGWQSARPCFSWASSIQCLRPWAGSKIALLRVISIICDRIPFGQPIEIFGDVANRVTLSLLTI
jgi:UDP-glucose 4-epimerase